jgi:plasmid stability protein
MKNVTITIDESVARWARIRAAEKNTSMSRLIGEFLREQMLAEETYFSAMQHYLAAPAGRLKEPEERYPSREERHER